MHNLGLFHISSDIVAASTAALIVNNQDRFFAQNIYIENQGTYQRVLKVDKVVPLQSHKNQHQLHPPSSKSSTLNSRSAE